MYTTTCNRQMYNMISWFIFCSKTRIVYLNEVKPKWKFLFAAELAIVFDFHTEFQCIN